MIKIITFIFLILFVAAANSVNCNGSMLSVLSSTDSNGVYSYNISVGDESLTFGGSGMLSLQIPSIDIQEIFSPPGWTSAVSDNIAIWVCTNDNAYITTQTATFSLRSSIAVWTNYSTSSAGYPAGKIIGSVYYTNGILYTIDSGTNDYIMSENIAGYESFDFVGPIIPEPMLFWLAFLYFLISLRRAPRMLGA